MEGQKKKCSLKEHIDINAFIYCKKCEIYMCNKCEVHHSKLFENHKNFILKENISDIYNEFCDEENHQNNKLNYFCKNHNKLCCAACIAKIQGKGDGQHKDCDVCIIEDIKDEKKNKIKDNIKLLEELSSKFNESFVDIKNIYEQINEKKEKIKLIIQKVFTNIRNILNNREDELLLNVDKEYDNLYLKEDIMKNIEKLPNKIKSSLEKCKNIDNISENNIYKLISESTEIENNINIINNINSNINNIFKASKKEIKFKPDENEMNKFIEEIKTFGRIYSKKDNILNKSLIIKDDMDSIDLINNWIEEAVNSKEIEFELIFKMSENGTKASDFHKYCDNKGPTLTLVKTTKNKLFGGFTPLNWNNQGGGIQDLSNKTFIFSLNLKKKYNMIKANGRGISCNSNNGPNFGDCDFRLKVNMKNGETYANSSCNFLRDNNLELTGGCGSYEDFEVEELEIYKVIY